MNIGNTLAEIVMGLLGAGALRLIYSLLKTKHSGAYVSLDDGMGFYQTATLFRYLAFRLAPIYLVASFMFAFLENANKGIAVAGLTLTVLHGLDTSVRAMVARVRSGVKSSLSLVIYTASFLLVPTGVILASSTVSFWTSFVPSGKEIVNSLWTALIAALLVMGLQSVKDSSMTGAALVALSEKRLRKDPDALAAYESLDKLAVEFNADLKLLQSIVLVENVQRPVWMRKLEHAFGRAFGGNGTYGVAQIFSSEPLSNQESVKRLADNLRDSAGLSEGQAMSNKTLYDYAMIHNGSEKFAVTLNSVFEAL